MEKGGAEEVEGSQTHAGRNGRDMEGFDECRGGVGGLTYSPKESLH